MSREAGPQWVGAGQTVQWGRGGKLCPRHEPSGIVGSPRLRRPEGTQAAPAWNPAPRSSGAGGPSSRWCQQRGAQSSHRAGPGPGSQRTSHPGTHGSFTPARVSFGPTEMEMSLTERRQPRSRPRAEARLGFRQLYQADVGHRTPMRTV